MSSIGFPIVFGRVLRQRTVPFIARLSDLRRNLFPKVARRSSVLEGPFGLFFEAPSDSGCL